MKTREERILEMIECFLSEGYYIDDAIDLVSETFNEPFLYIESIWIKFEEGIY